MTCYKFKCFHWLKLQHSGWRANLVKDFFLNKFSTNESTRIVTGHVIYNPAYTYKYQLKTTIIMSTLVHPTLQNTKCNAFSQQLPYGPSKMYRPGDSKEKPVTGLGLYIIDGPYGM